MLIDSRTERLLGADAMNRIRTLNIAVFGVGGVGSWCAEALVRTGVGRITIVDADCVAESNINRQLMATLDTVGQPKVEVLKQRFLTINPQCEVTALQCQFKGETASEFELDQYDCVIDAIDSLEDKAQLILAATRTRTLFLSSMGAALKVDPTRIRVAEFWTVKGCPLARALRDKFKRRGVKPSRKFKCVYSDELLPNLGTIPDEQLRFNKVAYNGSLCHITGIYGFTLAGLAIDRLTNQST